MNASPEAGTAVRWRTRIKICGLTRWEDVDLACQLGADAVGVVFAASPRRLGLDRAAELLADVPGFVCRVGVFAGQTLEYVRDAVHRCHLDWAQLCGGESAAFARSMPEGLRVLRVVHVLGPEDVDGVRGYPAAGFLLDSPPSQGRQGGTGRTFDWTLAMPGGRLPWPRSQVVLAGGLSPDNVALAIHRVRPGAVDVSSGVEAAPGTKDPARLARFFTAVRQADAENYPHTERRSTHHGKAG